MLLFKDQAKALYHQAKKQNNIIEAYLRAFANYEQNNWARLLLKAEFSYKNVKNTSTSYTLFKLNYSYYLFVSYKKILIFASS